MFAYSLAKTIYTLAAFESSSSGLSEMLSPLARVLNDSKWNSTHNYKLCIFFFSFDSISDMKNTFFSWPELYKDPEPWIQQEHLCSSISLGETRRHWVTLSWSWISYLGWWSWLLFQYLLKLSLWGVGFFLNLSWSPRWKTLERFCSVQRHWGGLDLIIKGWPNLSPPICYFNSVLSE